MRINPQSEIKSSIQQFSINANYDIVPEAIYIPFYKRYKYLINLITNLLDLNLDLEIIILVSSLNDKTKIESLYKNKRIQAIFYQDYFFTQDIKQLKTFLPREIDKSISNWDLPLKRNFALLYSKLVGFSKILLLDDDMDNITLEKVNTGTAALSVNEICGCYIGGFPDTSLVGHLKYIYGETYVPFLSGSFLFINLTTVESFFPAIYNEDWLFMIPSIERKRISAIDVAIQRKYNPFSLHRANMQEFGEVIVEGLFHLIAESSFNERYNLNFWDDFILFRKDYINELFDFADLKYFPLIKKSLHICEQITPIECKKFIHMWEEDIFKFKNIFDGI